MNRNADKPVEDHLEYLEKTIKLYKVGGSLILVWMMLVPFYVLNPNSFVHLPSLVLALVMLVPSKLFLWKNDYYELLGGEPAVCLFQFFGYLGIFALRLLGLSSFTSFVLSFGLLFILILGLHVNKITVWFSNYNHLAETLTEKIWSRDGSFILFSKKAKT